MEIEKENRDVILSFNQAELAKIETVSFYQEIKRILGVTSVDHKSKEGLIVLKDCKNLSDENILKIKNLGNGNHN